MQRLFIIFAMLCGFLISFEYAIVRPVSNAVFLTAHGSQTLPWAWILMVPLNLLLVSLYNHFLPRWGCLKMMLSLSALTICIHTFSSYALPHISWLPFVFYLWKEVYIMLMFQQLWSLIQVNIDFKQGKYLYGLFFAVGSLGAMLGSTIPGFFAVKLGSETLLLATLPLYVLLSGCYALTLKYSASSTGSLTEKKTSRESFVHGFKLIASSRSLVVILLLVVFMQFSSTLIDFQFNTLLEGKAASKDLKTEYTGKILSLVHAVTLSLQLFGSFLLIHLLGVKRSHLLIPLLLCLNALAFQFFPVFGVISFAYIAIKSCDFSLFNILKELLYSPLQPHQKFQAKALIDVFAHRFAKALASFLILGLQALLGAQFIHHTLNWSGFALFAVWFATIALLLKTPQPLENQQ